MRRTPGSVDTSNIVYVCRGEQGIDQALLREMLGYFIDENRRRVQQAADAAAAGDRDALRQLAHAIRGSAAMIGAGYLHDLASALERDAPAAQDDTLRLAVGAMTSELVAVHAALRSEHPEAVSD
jgi:HPt (histidine-containing phosphotransfer) domain-containing protein